MVGISPTHRYPPPPPPVNTPIEQWIRSKFRPPVSEAEIARREIKENNMATCGKSMGSRSWDDQNRFKFGIGATESEVYEHFVWMIDNIYMSAGIQYLIAQFERGYTPKPLFGNR